MKVLVTAFEPFGMNKINSSLIALNNLNHENIIKLILPVTYQDSFNKLKEQINDIDFIIMLGMAELRDFISLEERAINKLDFRIPDNNNLTIVNQKISESNNEFLYTKIDLDKLLIYLNDPNLVKSSDAGTYICNYLYYKVLEQINIPSIFIHIPLYKTECEFEYLNTTLEKILKFIGENYEKNN